MKGKANARPGDDTAESRILSEAGRLFMEKGYAATSTTEIARGAGCNQALVHYYFRTKENLFNRVFEEKVRHIFTEFLSVEATGGSFGQKLRTIISLHYDVIRRNQLLVSFVVNELSRDPSRVEQIRRGLGELPALALDTFEKELQGEIAAGRIRSIELRQLVLNIVSLNVMSFILKPVLGQLWDMDGPASEEFLDRRREEIVESVMLSLRPL